MATYPSSMRSVRPTRLPATTRKSSRPPLLAVTMGLKFDAESAWDERKQIFKTSGLIIRTTNASQSATGDMEGRWTTCVAEAVLLP
jgi:hypothetical protein